MPAAPHPSLKRIASTGQKASPSPLVLHLKSPQPENTGDTKETESAGSTNKHYCTSYSPHKNVCCSEVVDPKTTVTGGIL